MLSEARARLANTQGKKAKRKARERQLEEARRLAAIQKRRELKSAGINIGIRKKGKGMDLNADIPFHKPAPVGFHDVSEEVDREEGRRRRLAGSLLSRLEGKRRAEVEESAKKRDSKKMKTKMQEGEYLPAQALKEAQEAEARAIANRKTLVLPAPQMTDAELQEVIRIGQSGQMARTMIETVASSSDDFSRGLLSDYEAGIPASTPLRTPRQPTARDDLKVQARNLKAMTESQTPLFGDTVQMEGDIAFEGAAPQKVVQATPNPMSVHLTPRASSERGNMTPRVGGTAIAPVNRTPLRDQMGINTPRVHDGSEFTDSMSMPGTPRSTASGLSSMSQQAAIRSQLKSLFSALPKPKNDFDIVVPTVQADGVNGKSNGIIVDAEDLDAAQKKSEQDQMDAEYRRRSSAVKMGLPRPSGMTTSKAKLPKDLVDALIAQEMEAMINYDAVHYPLPGQKPFAMSSLTGFEHYEESELNRASDLVDEELKRLEASLKDMKLKFEAKFAKDHERVSKEYLFVPKPTPKYVHVPSLSSDDKVDSLAILLETYREDMKREAAAAQKVEKKLEITLGGYMARAQGLKKEISQTAALLQEAHIERQSFLMLHDLEQVGLPHRLSRVRKENEVLLMKDRDRQEKYATLKDEEEELENWIRAHS